MVYFTDAAAYMEQSILLLQARPTTTRISTRYTLSPPQKPKANTQVGGASESDAASQVPRSRGYLILKTYDPVSGTCLKYRTSKQAEIGRLIAGMGRCARVMANVPLQSEEEETQQQQEAAAGTTTTAGAEAEQGKQQQAQQSGPSGQQPSGGGGGGGGKKKKKGKK